MYTLLCDVIFFAHAQVIQAALKNTLLLRHTWREVLHGRLHFGKVPFDRGAESTIAGYPNVLSQAYLPGFFYYNMQVGINISLRVFKRIAIAFALPALCLCFAFALLLYCLCFAFPFQFPFEWVCSPKRSTLQGRTTNMKRT